MGLGIIIMYLLDTNVCIRYLNGQSPAIQQKFESLSPEDKPLLGQDQPGQILRILFKNHLEDPAGP